MQISLRQLKQEEPLESKVSGQFVFEMVVEDEMPATHGPEVAP